MGSSIQFTDGAATGPRSLFTGTPEFTDTLRRYQELGYKIFAAIFQPSIDGLLKPWAIATEVRPQLA
jgi:hypothetical protein